MLKRTAMILNDALYANGISKVQRGPIENLPINALCSVLGISKATIGLYNTASHY